MRASFSFFVCASIVVRAAVLPQDPTDDLFSLPASDSDLEARTSALALKRAGWEYGPSIAGNTAFYPSGSLGGPAAKAEADELLQFQNLVSKNVSDDQKAAGAAIVAAGGLKTLNDYTKWSVIWVYIGLWTNSAPKGPYPGVLTNYTHDLTFSMAQLSGNPYRIIRVAKDAALPFAVPNAKSLSTLSLTALQSAGRLFLTDFLEQKAQPKSPSHFGAACQAYFYIHPESGDFLPLAIKPNVDGAEDLVYTPQDEENDWQLAKMMFNQNSVWYAQFYHLGSTHVVAEIVYLAAIRTLSEEHPVMAILRRLMKDAWAIRPAAVQRLLFPGGPIEQLFASNGTIAGDYTSALYKSGESGAFQANYFKNNLAKRVPFFEDASIIHTAIRKFMTELVDSYYKSPKMLAKDTELQAWISEAVQAQIIDFPSAPLKNKETLIDILTHVAHLVSIAHGTLNTNSPLALSGSLPFSPFAFYSPLPTSKNISTVMLYMPKEQASIGQISLVAAFNRPSFVDSEETITHMFDDNELLKRMNGKVQKAEGVFREEMERFSKVVRGRGFNERGLSQGMPFLWGTLDPNTASYWLTV